MEHQLCEDVLSQISAAKSALNEAGQVVPEGHIRHCIKDTVEQGDDEEIENLTKAIERFAIAIQINSQTKGGSGGWCRTRRRTQACRRKSRTTTKSCANRRAELVLIFVWTAIICSSSSLQFYFINFYQETVHQK